MKLRRPLLPLLAVCICFTGSTPAATDQYWNPGGSGGDGIWGTGPGDKNWNITTGAPAGNTTWQDTGDETANFQDAVGGTITVFDTVTASAIALNGAAYTLNAGVITLVPDAAAAAPFVDVQTGTLTVDSELAGTSGLRKTGGGDLLLSGSNTYSGLTAVTGGSLNLTGSLASTTVEISAGASMLDSSGGLANTAVLTNAGTLTVNAPDTIASLTNNAGTVNGTATLTVTGATVFNGGTLAAPLTLNGTGGGTFANATLAGTFNGTAALDGATVSGTLNGNTTSIGNTLVSGSLGGGSLVVNDGILNLTGSATHTPISISGSATLIDANGGLSSLASITSAGTLTVNAADTITSYISNGGTLTGTGQLTTSTAHLFNGSLVSGSLTATDLISHGAVSITGSAVANSINLTGDVLTNTGTLTATGGLNISSGVTLVAGGTQSYHLLTTSGPGAGTWQGNLTNPATATVAPGGTGSIGTLAVTGDFTNAPPGGTLSLDLGTGIRDLVTVGGTATFGGNLVLNQLSPITPFIPVQVVAATAYVGNFSTLTENLDGVVWFNPANGTVMTLSLPPAIGPRLWNSTANQTSTWISLYDDVIDPNDTNITHVPGGGYTITSGLADAGNPDLLNALSASFAPGGLNAAVLDRLSPEVYAGFQDYAIHATRSHQRAALEAPSLGFIQAPQASGTKDAKGALPAPPVLSNPWEYFAAVDYFNVRTDSSPNNADYRISGFGFIAGARTSLTDRIRVGGYFAGDSGSVDGSLIDADVTGWSLGLYAKALIDDRTHTLITGGLSYGKYSFDGNRSSLIATGGGGWSPQSGFDNVDSDAFEFFLGASSIIYQTDKFRLLPAAGLRYVCGGMDGFGETTGGPGSPVALVVGKDNYQSALAEISLRAEADLTDRFTLDGRIGFTMTLGDDDPAALSARFATGNRAFRATAEGLDEDAFFCGLGATWRVRDNVGVGLHWRADFRSDADPENQVGLSAAFRF